MFESDASNLVTGDTNDAPDIFVRDRDAGVTTRVSVANNGAQVTRQSNYPAVSADGQRVAFYSEAWDLVAGDTNNTVDVFVRDRAGSTTTRVSVSTAGTQADGASYYHAISGDGLSVVFLSVATNLVPGDTNGVRDIFVNGPATVTDGGQHRTHSRIDRRRD